MSVTIIACSALVNHADSQCAVDADCAKFAGTVCVQGGCVAPTALPDSGRPDVAPPPPVTSCTTTQDCLPEHGGVNWVCRRSDNTCVSLVSQDCASVAGQYADDDVVLIGALLPLFGPHASTGAALANALRMAVGDFAGGLPSVSDGGTSRPIAIVMCNESDDVDRAARHLRDDLGIPVVIGAGQSESTLRAATDVTRAGHQLLISPRATADLSSVDGDGLVWRTVPSDALEAAAMAAVYKQQVVPALAQGGVTTPKVIVLHQTDPESKEIAAKVEAILGGGDAGAAAPTDVDFGDPDDPANGDPTPLYTDAIQTVTSAIPDAILFIGETQGVTSVLSGVETNWPNVPRRAQYVVSSAAKTKELLTLIGTNDALRKRILGTAPGATPGAYANLSKFLVRYRQTYKDGTLPEVFGVAAAYDAFYAVAYAAAVTHNVDLNGDDMLAAMRLVYASQNATSVDVGPQGIPGALGVLTKGGSLAVKGASAPLAFDLQTGDVVTDVQVWCVLRGQSDLAFQDSGLSWVASASQLQGTFGGGCGQ